MGSKPRALAAPSAVGFLSATRRSAAGCAPAPKLASSAPLGSRARTSSLASRLHSQHHLLTTDSSLSRTSRVREQRVPERPPCAPVGAGHWCTLAPKLPLRRASVLKCAPPRLTRTSQAVRLRQQSPPTPQSLSRLVRPASPSSIRHPRSCRGPQAHCLQAAPTLHCRRQQSSTQHQRVQHCAPTLAALFRFPCASSMPAAPAPAAQHQHT